MASRDSIKTSADDNNIFIKSVSNNTNNINARQNGPYCVYYPDNLIQCPRKDLHCRSQLVASSSPLNTKQSKLCSTIQGSLKAGFNDDGLIANAITGASKQLLANGTAIDSHSWNNLPLVILCNTFSYLCPVDRLRASSACKSWRNVIYHSSLWPQKHLKVNLCPHKFSISCQHKQNTNVNSGFHTFSLRAPTIRKNNANNNSGYFQRRSNRQNFNSILKNFIQKCSRFLTGITFYFDPNSSYNVIDLIKILKHLSENEVAIYELNSQQSSNVYSNCRNLKYFELVPVTTLTRCAVDQRFTYLYYGLTDSLRFLISKCQSLEHVSFGGLHELINSTEEFLPQFIKAGHEQSLRCLHLSSIKGNAFWQLKPASIECLSKFILLQSLSIDFDLIDTRAVTSFAKLVCLQSVTINVHQVSENHPGITSEAWSQLTSALPNLAVTLNLLHTDSDYFGTVIQSLINTSIPLKHIRAYYLEFAEEHAQSLMCNLLDILARRHAQTLHSLTLVDHLERPRTYLKSVSPNSLVMLTWRCSHLKSLTIIGFVLTDIDLIAIVRLRGTALENFYFPASCIQLTRSFCGHSIRSMANSGYGSQDYCFFDNEICYFNKASYSIQRAFNEFISVPLKRYWQPLASYEVPEVAIADYIPQLTYHRTILEQNDCHCNTPGNVYNKSSAQ